MSETFEHLDPLLIHQHDSMETTPFEGSTPEALHHLTENEVVETGQFLLDIGADAGSQSNNTQQLASGEETELADANVIPVCSMDEEDRKPAAQEGSVPKSDPEEYEFTDGNGSSDSEYTEESNYAKKKVTDSGPDDSIPSAGYSETDVLMGRGGRSNNQ